MPGSISTSKLASLGLALALLVAWSPLARAADAPPPSTPPAGNDRTAKPEEEDFSETPYTEYGSFNEEKEEEEDTKFFKFGRFFGVSLGIGDEVISGDRGTLYQGGFPTIDAKIHYWFDFNFALDIDFYLAQHYFISNSTTFNGRFNVNIVHLGVDLKYYFATKNLSAPITFANPYIMAGLGSYTKATSPANGQTGGTDTDTAVGFNAGAGLEFALAPRKVYFTVEGNIRFISFADTNTKAFQASEGLPDLNGNFFTFIGSVLFTW